jgi:Winged helix DNA-binding domain
LKPVVVVDGRVVGVWRRVLERERVIVEVSAFGDLSKAVVREVGVAARRYGKFLGREVEVVYG